MITVDDFYKEIRECTYKGEVYSVRDNGAVMRHSRQGKRIRKYDDVWTFGKIDEKTGYCNIGIERVHRIVAFAFLGDPPTPQHVVDHIDTNRQNNRPENLRWLTRLENALNNQITRARIENICGSIEVFIKNPAILHIVLCFPKPWFPRSVYTKTNTACTKRQNCSCDKYFKLWHSVANKTDYYEEIKSFTGV